MSHDPLMIPGSIDTKAAQGVDPAVVTVAMWAVHISVSKSPAFTDKLIHRCCSRVDTGSAGESNRSFTALSAPHGCGD